MLKRKMERDHGKINQKHVGDFLRNNPPAEVAPLPDFDAWADGLMADKTANVERSRLEQINVYRRWKHYPEYNNEMTEAEEYQGIHHNAVAAYNEAKYYIEKEYRLSLARLNDYRVDLRNEFRRMQIDAGRVRKEHEEKINTCVATFK